MLDEENLHNLSAAGSSMRRMTRSPVMNSFAIGKSKFRAPGRWQSMAHCGAFSLPLAWRQASVTEFPRAQK
jgi:hypothetical protein